MRSDWICSVDIEHVLAALTPENRLAAEISLATGLRIGDVLSLKTEQLQRRRFTVKEQKTGKSRRIYLPDELYNRALKAAGRFYVFEGRCDPKRHRTRQAVFKDIRRAARAFRLTAHVSPHSLRKAYAVELYHRSGGNIAKVQQLLNHSSEAVTMIYAMADLIGNRKHKPRLDKKSGK